MEILFANKSNNALAIRHIMNQEGAGGDCFGYNEMYLALLAGSDGRKLALNGSNKEPAEIELAIQNGVCNNIDAMDELDMIDETARAAWARRPTLASGSSWCWRSSRTTIQPASTRAAFATSCGAKNGACLMPRRKNSPSASSA